MALGEHDLSRLRGASEDALEGDDLLERTWYPLAPPRVRDPVHGGKEQRLARVDDARLHHSPPERGVATIAVNLVELAGRAGRMERHVTAAEKPVVPAP